MKLLPICATAMLPFSLNPFLVGFSYLSRMVFLQALPWAFFYKNEVDVLLAIRDTQKLSSSTFEKLASAKKEAKVFIATVICLCILDTLKGGEFHGGK